MEGNSKTVQSNQIAIHQDLHSTVLRHLNNKYSAPYKSFSDQAFDTIYAAIQSHDTRVILDSGCGTGESTIKLARLHPDALVIGIDKSMDRINETRLDDNRKSTDNYLIVRGDVIDIWRMLVAKDISLQNHYLLYPNPWPKKKHLMRRWHGHPIFPDLVRLGGKLELRTNWRIYAQEFAKALEICGVKNVKVTEFKAKSSITPFERKYSQSEHPLYSITCQI